VNKKLKDAECKGEEVRQKAMEGMNSKSKTEYFTTFTSGSTLAFYADD
jgi:hypothetical protein